MNTHPSVQKLTETANVGIQTFQSFAEIVLNASEQLVSLNLDAARSLCSYASTQTVPLTGEELRSQFASRVAAHGQNIERATEYLRNVSDICVKTQADVAELGAKQLSELSDSVQSLFHEVAKLTPVNPLEVIAVPASAARPARKAA